MHVCDVYVHVCDVHVLCVMCDVHVQLVKMEVCINLHKTMYTHHPLVVDTTPVRWSCLHYTLRCAENKHSTHIHKEK